MFISVKLPVTGSAETPPIVTMLHFIQRKKKHFGLHVLEKKWPVRIEVEWKLSFRVIEM